LALGGSLAFHLAAAIALGRSIRPTIDTYDQVAAGAGGPHGMIVSLVRMPPFTTQATAPGPPAPEAAAATPPHVRMAQLVAKPSQVLTLTSPGPRPNAESAVGSGAGGAAAAPPCATGLLTSGLNLDFLRIVQAHISRFKRFPADDSGEPIHGTVLIVFSMNRGGEVLGVAVKKSSGDARLDAEAIATIWRAQPMPQIPSPLPDQLGFIVPIDFATAGG
jgi:protein TonB